jgi:CheY-like chemotaxis protein
MNSPVELNASGRILIVDDEHVIRDSLGSLLEMMGYETISADDGFQALQILKEVHEGEREPLKAVILDLTIPGGMGGIDTIEIIRRFYPQLPVFVSSGYAENPVMAEPQKYGFTASIGKPFTFEELAAILKEYLS